MKATTQTNRTILINALENANAKYKERNPLKQNLNAVGINPNIQTGINLVNAMTDAQIDSAVNVVDTAKLSHFVGTSTNIKVAMRSIDLLMLLVSNDLRYCRGSAKTFLLCFANLMTGNIKVRDGMLYIVTGKGDEDTSSQIPSLQRARAFINALGAVGRTSAQTQLSVAFSAGGIADCFGAITPFSGAGGRMPEIDKSAPSAHAIERFFLTLSDGKLASIIAKDK